MEKRNLENLSHHNFIIEHTILVFLYLMFLSFSYTRTKSSQIILSYHLKKLQRVTGADLGFLEGGGGFSKIAKILPTFF